jgi:hypothetical protein
MGGVLTIAYFAISALNPEFTLTAFAIASGDVFEGS